MKHHKITVALVGLGIIVALDQLIKYFIISNMALGEERELLPCLSLFHARNEGIAFSMLSSFNNSGLVGLTMLVIVCMLYLWWKVPTAQKLSQVGYLMVIGGAIGNLVDRARLHYVIDYIYFHIADIFHFAIFNLADTCITVGVLCIILDEILSVLHDKKCKAQSS